MRLALAQINPTVGDITGNARLIVDFARRAAQAGADVVVYPELALTGYPPKDLLLVPAFVDACAAACDDLARALPAGITAIVGAPLRTSDGHLGNALLALRQGVRLARYDKRLLPTYDVFDENRYFVPGTVPVVFDVAGIKIGLSVCEDLWRGQDVGFSQRYMSAPDPVAELIEAGARVIVNPSASPFVLGKGARHRELLRTHAQRHGVYVAAVNQIGGNDELIFDGHAAVFDPQGSLVAAGRGFEQDLVVIKIDGARSASDGVSLRPDRVDPVASATGSMPDEELLFHALTLGVRDYARKTGFTSAVLGLSGGIDSALVAVLAVAALGPANVTGLLMPSRYSSPGSLADAQDLADRLGMTHHVVPIEGAFGALESALTPIFAGKKPDVSEENLQSRVRGTLLMGVSNKFNHLLLTTGNKSELAVGYCTLYGDMNGGLAVISDVLKTQVYTLSRWINAHWPALGIAGLSGPPIPETSLTKAPSAELRANQTDQDSLPPYDVLDEIIERVVERRQPPEAIVRESKSIDAPTLRRVLRLIDLAEYKRKQAPIGLKVTGVAFGSGRRMPIAQGFRIDKTL